MPLRDDIAAAASQAKIGKVLQSTLRKLEDKLMGGEEVVAITQAGHENKPGLLVHTNYRVLFTLDGIGGRTTEAVALERVSSVRWTRDLTTKGGRMVVETPNRTMLFTAVPERFALAVQSVTA